MATAWTHPKVADESDGDNDADGGDDNDEQQGVRIGACTVPEQPGRSQIPSRDFSYLVGHAILRMHHCMQITFDSS